MNFIVGMAGKPSSGQMNVVCEKFSALYGDHCRLIDAGKSGFALYNKESLITGVSEKQAQTLIMHGAVHHPVFEWENDESPLENISVTASHLLDLWKKNGTEAAGMASGAFLGCVFDKNSGKRFLFCDSDGMRNLYTYTHDHQVWFSNNPRLLALTAPGIKIDRSLENFFLVYGFWPDGRTAYHGVKVLPAGQVMEIENNDIHFHR